MTTSRIVVLDTGPMMSMIDQTDKDHRRAQVFFKKNKPSTCLFITAPPNVTELDHLVRKKKYQNPIEVLSTFFAAFSITIMHAEDEQKIFESWISYNFSDHKGQLFDYADYYLYQMAKATFATQILTIDGGLHKLVNQDKKSNPNFELKVSCLWEIEPDFKP